MTPAALAAVRDLLLPGVSLADASNWADSQREVPDSGPWHYVNVTLSESRYNARFCQPGGCVASRIEDFRQVLLDPRAEKTTKQQALKFLIHFIQDLHQFLHVGDTGSRGGNLLQVRFFDVGSNLHHVWHSQLIEWHNRDEDRWLREVDALATPENSAAWSKGMPEGWATESLEAARAAYCLPGTRAVMESGTALDEAYCQCMLPIVQRQTATAGIRVAAVLNEIFR